MAAIIDSVNAVFLTPAIAAIFIAIKALIGAVIGFFTAVLAKRSRPNIGLGIRAALFGAVAFLIASGLAGWAGLHSYFENGQRMDKAPWGEDLWLRNRIVENGLAICIASSVIAGILAGAHFRRVRRTN